MKNLIMVGVYSDGYVAPVGLQYDTREGILQRVRWMGLGGYDTSRYHAAEHLGGTLVRLEDGRELTLQNPSYNKAAWAAFTEDV